ncbi:hypothetical protein LXA43DRAFT_1066885 [Ganoderma leucocontextum]|nr:hypothetical protein LXA43DRAFT_1066885 [Ganoderma leucocontextum]
MTLAAYGNILARVQDTHTPLDPDATLQVTGQFMEILRGLPSYEEVPDGKFSTVFDALHDGAKAGRLPYATVRDFATSYSLESRSFRSDHFAKEGLAARRDLVAAQELHERLRNATAVPVSPSSVAGRKLADTQAGIERAEEMVRLVESTRQRADFECSEVAKTGVFHHRFLVYEHALVTPPTRPVLESRTLSAPRASASAPRPVASSASRRTSQPVSSEDLEDHVDQLADNSSNGGGFSDPETPLPKVSNKPSKRPMKKGGSVRYQDLKETPELATERAAYVERNCLIGWPAGVPCDPRRKVGADCEASKDQGEAVCDRCRTAHAKCTRFGRNSHGEIKGRDRNVPVAIFNGSGHSILASLDDDDRAWVEAVIRAIEQSPEASNLVSVKAQALVQHVRRPRFSSSGRSGKKVALLFLPNGSGPTMFEFDPATLPRYDVLDLPSPESVPQARQFQVEVSETGEEPEDSAQGSVVAAGPSARQTSRISHKCARDEPRSPVDRKGKRRARSAKIVEIEGFPLPVVPEPSPPTPPAVPRFSKAQTARRGRTNHFYHPRVLSSDDVVGAVSREPSEVALGAASPPLDDGVPAVAPELADGGVVPRGPLGGPFGGVGGPDEPRGNPLLFGADDSVGMNTTRLSDLLAAWHEQGAAPAALLQHSAFAIHIGALHTAYSDALSRQLIAQSDQRRYAAAESFLTGLPFSQYQSEWLSDYSPAVQREFYAQLGPSPNSEGMSLASASWVHMGGPGALRGVGGLGPGFIMPWWAPPVARSPDSEAAPPAPDGEAAGPSL